MVLCSGTLQSKCSAGNHELKRIKKERRIYLKFMLHELMRQDHFIEQMCFSHFFLFESDKLSVKKTNFTASRKNEDINMWALFPEDFNANNFIQRKNKNEFVYTKIVYFFYISVWWVVTTMLWAFISELRGFISKNVAVPLQPLKIFTDFGFMTLPRWPSSRKT